MLNSRLSWKLHYLIWLFDLIKLMVVLLSVANSITAVQILKTKAVIVQVFDHFSPKYAVIVRVLSD
jgi:hypothetical protein